MPARIRRLLCADDEEDIVEIIKICLSTIPDLEVICCRDGAAAVEKARETMPDLILLDVMMPVMDGPTALQELKRDASLTGIPVVLMTARVQPPEVDDYLRLGATAVIPKPFDPMTLADEVESIWRKGATATRPAEGRAEGASAVAPPDPLPGA